MDAQVYDLLRETLALAGTVGASLLGTLHALKRWQAGREAKDAQQDARLEAVEGRACCVRLGGALPTAVPLPPAPLAPSGGLPDPSKNGG
jgi:hypothetical protein